MADERREPDRAAGPAPTTRVHIRSQPDPLALAAEPPSPVAPGALGSGAALLGVRPEELRRTALLTAYLFTASCVFVLGRTARDALFLSHYRDRVGELLPFMFIAYGVASALVSVLYSALVSRVRRDRFVLSFCAIGAVGYTTARVLLLASPGWLFGALYVGAEIIGNLTLTQFWSIANDLHDPRSAKRLFGIIGTGRIVGMVACGLGTGSFVHEIGTENLLLVVVVLLGAIAALVVVLERDYGFATRAVRSRREHAEVRHPLRSPYVRALAALMLLGFIAVNVGDFQFKAAARLIHPSRDDLAHFMALYYATLGAVGLLLQLFGTRWVLRRFGVAGGLLAMPVAYFLANLLLLAMPGLRAATVLKLSDNAFQFTIFESALQLLYFPLPAETKDSVRAALDGLVKPLGYALAGVVVLAMRAWQRPDSMHAIANESWFVLPIVAVWIAMVPRARTLYLRSLERSLSRREAEPGPALVDDPNTRGVLLRTARGAAPRAATYALEQLITIDPVTARGELPSLLRSPVAVVRAAVLRAAARLDAREMTDAVSAALVDPDDAVAAAAAEALGELAGEECAPSLAPYVHSPRRALQDAVVATLLRHGGLEGMLAAGHVVESWLGSSDAADRARAATLFARPGIPGLARVVRKLLADPDRAVRRAAIVAAGAVGDPTTCELILTSMADPASEGAATQALARIGKGAIVPIERALENADAPRAARLALPRVLRQIGTRDAYEALLRHIDAPDEWLRQKVLASASRARAAHGFDRLEPSAALPRMVREIEGTSKLREAYAAVRTSLAIPLMDRWLIERLRKGLVRGLRLGELAYPRAEVAAARDAVFSPIAARRAGAVEILENLFGVRARELIVRELDAWLALRDATLPVVPTTSTGREEAFLRQLVVLPEPFARVVALDAAQFRNVRLPDDVVRELTRDADAAVREMAALVVATFRPDAWRDTLDALRGDDDRRVATYARYAFETGRTGMEPSDEMYTTIEKVLFLQRIPLFADVPAEHLVSLARSTEVDHLATGSVVFRKGEPGDALYFVIEGRVRVVAPGREDVTLGEGEVFGEMSVLDSSPRTDEIVVDEDATLLRIAQEDFYDVLYETTELAQGVIHVLVRRLRAATRPG